MGGATENMGLLPDSSYWRDTIASGSATFLVGAGVSAPAPSNLPLATDLVEAVVGPVLHSSGLPRDLSRSITRTLLNIRPEVITDILIEHLGIRAINPLPTLLRARPNAWHRLLASSLGTGCCVVTTNFDTLIEDTCLSWQLPITCLVGGTMRRLPAIPSERPKSILFKVHGSVGGPAGLRSLALALRQVGRGLSDQQYSLLRLLIHNRPLIVLGYSGRDEFDLLPALLSIGRTSDALWIIHNPNQLPQPLAPTACRRRDVRPALECSKAWTRRVHIVIGDTGRTLHVLRPRGFFGTGLRSRRPGRRLARIRAAPSLDVKWGGRSCSPTIALVYGLMQCRAFTLATRVIKHATRTPGVPSRALARILLAYALVLEKLGTDLRKAASVAAAAVKSATESGSVRTQALTLDQSGVIARRRGKYRAALAYYDHALRLARSTRCPMWLVMQIRSHRAIVLEYLKLRHAALREHRAVAAHERTTGDLRGLAKSLNNIGIVYMNQHRWRAAIKSLTESCSLKRQLGDARGTAQSLHNLGKTYYLAGDYKKAEETFLASLRLRLGRARDSHGVAQSHAALAQVALRTGRWSEARRLASLALKTHASYGDSRGVSDARAILRRLHGK